MPTTEFPAGKLTLFAILSATDFLLTWHLVGRDGYGVYEANPLAGWWLQQHGWGGLAAYKIGLVLVIGGLIVLIGSRRPRAAGRVLVFGCVALAGVVVCGVRIAACDGGPIDVSSRDELDGHAAGLRHMERELERTRHYRAMLLRMCGDVVAGRRSLAEAAALLGTTERAADPAWMARLRAIFPGLDDRGCLAANIVQNALRSPDLFPEVGRAAARMREELRGLCGVDVALAEEALDAAA